MSVYFCRYESTIRAQFFGHTHFDEMELFYAEEDPFRASSVAYVGPSVTPYFDLNPGYRIYYVDGEYPASTRVSLGGQILYSKIRCTPSQQCFQTRKFELVQFFFLHLESVDSS